MKKFTIYLIAILIYSMGFAGIHTWDILTEDNGRIVPNQMDQLKEKHVDPTFLAQLLADIKAKVSSLDGVSGFLDDKIITDYTLQKQIIDATSNLKIELAMCDFSGLSALNLQSLDCLIAQDLDGIKRKIPPELLYAFSQRAWIREGIDNSQFVPVSEITDTQIDLTSLDPVNVNFLKNVHLTWGYGDNQARCLGRISTIGSIGASYLEEDLVKMNGTLLVIGGQDYSNTENEQCWFSIKIDDPNLADGFGIRYFMSPVNMKIDLVINAVFQFHYPPGTNDPSQAKWILKTYETLRTWTKRVSLNIINYPNAYVWTITNLPFQGTYHIDVRLRGDRIRTSQVCGILNCPLGSLTAQGSGDGTARTLDEGDRFNFCNNVGPDPTFDGDNWGLSLQGSCFVKVTGTDCTNRAITITVIGYTPALPDTIVSGYMGDISSDVCYCDIEYKGLLDGHDCNEFLPPPP